MNTATAAMKPQTPTPVLLEVEAASLHNAIKLAAHVSGRRSTISALKNIKLTVTQTALIVRATDLDVETQSTILTSSCTLVGETQSVCLSPEALQMALPKKGAVKLQIEGNHLRLGSYAIETFDEESYPQFDIPWTSVSAVLELAKLRRVAFAMSKDATRFNLCACYFESVNGQLRLVTTDGHRLALLDTGLPYQGKVAIVPSRAIEILLKLRAENAVLGIAGDRIVFSVPQWGALRVKPVEGEYPDYRIVLPRNGAGSFQVRREEWAAALKRLLPLCKASRLPVVRYEIPSSRMALTMTATHDGVTGSESIPVLACNGDIDGLQEGFGLNPHYVRETLGSMDEEKVIVSCQDAASPFRFAGEGDQSAVHVIMPVRV